MSFREIVLPFLVVHAVAATTAVFVTAAAAFLAFGPPD
jgi:hypothetical protein